MPDYETLIPYTLKMRYDDLLPRLAEFTDQLHIRARSAPTAPAGPLTTALTADLLSQTYRIVSLEPFAAALPRPRPDTPQTYAGLLDLLAEADAALSAFRAAHYNEDREQWRIDHAPYR